jgi:hypothetical protein
VGQVLELVFHGYLVKGCNIPVTYCRSLAADAPRDREREPRRMWYFAEWRRRFLAVSKPIPRFAPGVIRYVLESQVLCTGNENDSLLRSHDWLA